MKSWQKIRMVWLPRALRCWLMVGRVTKCKIFFAFYTQNRRAFLAPLAALPLGSTLRGDGLPPKG